MSAPVVERPRGATRTAPRPSRSTPVAIPAQRGAGAQKAYAKRDERLRRLVGGVRPGRGGTPRRAQFVLLVMVLLGAGLVLTLWLSTAAAADSYRLQDARAAAGALGERSEQLRREVAVMASAPEIARRAGEMGMVPVQDPARLVVAADGSVGVVGDPRVVRAPAPPAPPAPVAGAVPAEAPVGDAGAVGDAPAADTPAEDVPAEDVPAGDTAPDEVLAGDSAAAPDESTDAAAAGTEPTTAPN